ncbi:hypothetical protein RUM43_007319 [Polyplax serrata]|uniref:REM-1 domain-containing protein n=1 Tax=Polyplax serrata TaxID=468196 RepID=A0AAN8S8M3_POLSC
MWIRTGPRTVPLSGDTRNTREDEYNDKESLVVEYDLEQKIDLEIKMREGTTKLLAACKHRSQSLEAAKNLLTSNERMSAYMSELQRRKKETPCRGLGYPKISRARLSLSDLRMPLIWRDTDHFKNKGDYRRFAVFCLARVGTEIYDTSLLSPVDRSLTDLTFPDIMLFNNVPPDFEVRLEVYSHILQDDLTMASTSRKIKKTIHSSISRTVGKKLAATLNDELNAGKIGPRFELTATARLTLDEVHNSIRTHDLQIQPTDSRSHQLPLFGHFCCRLAAQPNSFTQEVCSGEVSVSLHDGNEEFTSDFAWARLQAFKLEFWNQRTFVEGDQAPFRVIPINKQVIVKVGKHSTEIIIFPSRSQKAVATLRFKNGEEQQKWLKGLNQQSDDHRRWRQAAESCLDVLTPGLLRNSFMKGFRQGSLYDQTPIIESVAPEVTTHRRTVQEIFGLTPSTSLSSCASSSSSSTFLDRSTESSRRTGKSIQRLLSN